MKIFVSFFLLFFCSCVNKMEDIDLSYSDINSGDFGQNIEKNIKETQEDKNNNNLKYFYLVSLKEIEPGEEILAKYTFYKNSGPQHRPIFKTYVQIRDSKKVIGIGNSKKKAQQSAASNLLKSLKIL